MKACKEFANAKINLYLDVTSMRDDGFHNIKTVMHSVSLADEIIAFYAPSKKTDIKMYILGDAKLPQDEKNLAYRAAALFLEKAGLTASIEIHLKKNIPIAAGLAGGSSDAAATLRAMNKLFGRLFSNSALLKMAEQLGSDVPYCLFGKTALCEGRGEIITRLNKNPRLNILVLNAGEYVKTPEAYAALDKIHSGFKNSVNPESEDKLKRLLASIDNEAIDLSALYNIFEDAVLPICPKAQDIRKRLLALGARASLMSGSGSSVFGVFENESDMLYARDLFLKENIRAYATKSV